MSVKDKPKTEPGPDRRPFRWIAALALGALAGFELFTASTPKTPAPSRTADATPPAPLATPPAPLVELDLQTRWESDLDALAIRLRERLTQRRMRPDEAVLIFKDAPAYHRFLARAAPAGLTVLARIDGLFAVRVLAADYAAFARELAAHVGDYTRLGPNPVVDAAPPVVEERDARLHVPVGDNLLAALGVDAPDPAWGRGVLVAVLDGGASPDSTLGNRLRYLDIGYGVSGSGADGRHGTAVAALVAGAAPGALGVAPSADVLSIRVTDVDGRSDAFTLAQGIIAALDAGARVINISLGGHSGSPILAEAVELALSREVAVVAAAGNDQAASLAWPAAYPGVVSVGAVDAVGQQTVFSNSGPDLQITAPGYALQTAGLGGARIEFTGTSASAPVVSGAIATLLSTEPELSPLAAADLLAAYSNEAGPLGDDPDYGRGTLNLGWALERAGASRADPALSSIVYAPSRNAIDLIVQNRGNRTETGLALTVAIGPGPALDYSVPPLSGGQAAIVSVPAPAGPPGTSALVSARLILPAGHPDRSTANNRLAAGIVYPR